MTTVTTRYDGTVTTAGSAATLRRVIVSALPFDAVMGVACLAAGGRFGHWLSIPAAAVRGTGGLFLLAALAGAVALRRRPPSVGWVVAANAVFAAWCAALLAAARPNPLGAALLAGSVLASGGTAVLEQRLARRG